MWPIFSTDIFGSLALFGPQPDYAPYSYYTPADGGMSGWGDAFGYATPRSFFYGDGFDSVRSVVGGPANARDWVRNWDARYAASGGGIQYTPKPENAPQMPDGDELMEHLFAAASGQLYDDQKKKPATVRDLPLAWSKALQAWAKQDPTNTSGVRDALSQLVQKSADQLTKGSATDRAIFVATAEERQGLPRGTDEASRAKYWAGRLANLLEAGASAGEESVARAANQLMQQQPPVGADAQKTDAQVAALYKMFVRAFGESNAQGMIEHLEKKASDYVQKAGTPRLPIISEAHVQKLISKKGYSTEQSAFVFEQIKASMAKGYLSNAEAWVAVRKANDLTASEAGQKEVLPGIASNQATVALVASFYPSRQSLAKDVTGVVARTKKGTEDWADFARIRDRTTRLLAVVDSDTEYTKVQAQLLLGK